jgi:integrase
MRYVAKEARWKVNGELVTKHFVESRINGKRERLSFDTKAQAKAYADARNVEILNEGIQHATFSAAQRILAQECADKLAPFGKTLRDATDFLLEHLRNAARSCTATQLVAELLAAKKADGVGAGHRKVVELRLAKFAEHFNGKVVSEITSKEIDQWLRSLQVGKRTRSHYRAHLVNAFNFAVRCGYASSNVAEGATKVKVDDAAPVGILTVEETARLLEAATPDILPMIAIGLFAGLRRSEIARLTWSEIDFESNLIHVKAEKSKTGKNRYVKIEPNLREWILPYRKLSGNVAPPTGAHSPRPFAHALRNAGIEWKKNAMRHSFASYHLAAFKNPAATAMELGHMNSAITYAHYRELVKPADAARYFSIQPVPSANVVRIIA